MRGRNYGADLLRILCMIMVPVLHVLGHGGVIEATQPHSPKYDVAWFLRVAADCAMDCFGLLSGYVGYGSRHRGAGLIRICAQATFYTIGATAVFAALVPGSVGLGTAASALVPFVREYWYLSAYFCLFFAMPYLDGMVAQLEETGVWRLVRGVVLVLSALPNVTCRDIPMLNGGYGFAWLAVLYVFSACIRRLEPSLPSYRNRWNPFASEVRCVPLCPIREQRVLVPTGIRVLQCDSRKQVRTCATPTAKTVLCARGTPRGCRREASWSYSYASSQLRSLR